MKICHAWQDPTGAGDMLHGSVGELGGKLPDLAGITEEMPFELKVVQSRWPLCHHGAPPNAYCCHFIA